MLWKYFTLIVFLCVQNLFRSGDVTYTILLCTTNDSHNPPFFFLIYSYINFQIHTKLIQSVLHIGQDSVDKAPSLLEAIIYPFPVCLVSHGRAFSSGDLLTRVLNGHNSLQEIKNPYFSDISIAFITILYPMEIDKFFLNIIDVKWPGGGGRILSAHDVPAPRRRVIQACAQVSKTNWAVDPSA